MENRLAVLSALVLCTHALIAGGGSLCAQELRMVVASDVACRAEPGTSAPVQRRYSVGERIFPQATALEGEVPWYLDSTHARGGSRGCWIFGGLTVPFDRNDPETALLAAADRILARRGDVPLAEWVAVENLLLRTPLGFSDSLAIDASPLLQLRRLQILQRAVRARDAMRWAAERDPLTLGWLLAHEPLIRPHEPSGGWVVEADRYWELYERYRDAPAAEEIAWAAAQGMVRGDECYAECAFDRIQRTYGRYWTELPAGGHAAEAIAGATMIVDNAARNGCGEADPEAVRQKGEQIIESLGPVKAPHQALIARIEALVCR